MVDPVHHEIVLCSRGKTGKYTLPEGITDIQMGAFEDCIGLAEIIAPDGLEYIWDRAFAGCTGLKRVILPDSLSVIGDGAFAGCTNLEAISIPDNVIWVGEEAFYDTAWYRNLPDDVVYIGRVAYHSKGGVMPENTDLVLREGTVAIGDDAFSGCIGLRSISLPVFLRSIGSGGGRAREPNSPSGNFVFPGKNRGICRSE